MCAIPAEQQCALHPSNTCNTPYTRIRGEICFFACCCKEVVNKRTWNRGAVENIRILGKFWSSTHSALPQQHVYLKLGQICAATVEELDHPEAPLHADAVRNNDSGAGLLAAHTGARSRNAYHLHRNDDLSNVKRSQFGHDTVGSTPSETLRSTLAEASDVTLVVTLALPPFQRDANDPSDRAENCLLTAQ